MAKQEEISVPEINQGIMTMVQFYGSLVATPNLDPKILKKCNENIAKLVEAMDYDSKDLVTLKIKACGKISI